MKAIASFTADVLDAFAVLGVVIVLCGAYAAYQVMSLAMSALRWALGIRG